jgi:acyl carrier protein
MNPFGSDELRVFLRDYLAKRPAFRGRDVPKELSEDCDLLLSGMVDSLGLLELMTALQGYCGREIDFDALDPEQMTVVGPLCDFVAGQMAKG